MSLTVGVNSWATVAESDSYFADMFGRSAWVSFSNTEKEQLLITAYRFINQNSNISIPANSTMDKVKYGQFEMSWYLYGYYDTHEERVALYAQGVREFDISKFGEKLEAPDFPSTIWDYFDDFLTTAGGSIGLINRSLPES